MPIGATVLTTITDSIGHFRARHGTKLIRFGAVSAFNVVFGQMMLYGAQVVLEWSPVAANMFAVSAGTIPGYMLSRYWVWEKRGKSHLLREVVPFWVLTLIGFAMSTAAVWFVSTNWDPTPLMVNVTNLSVFGIAWVAKFLILDRVLFRAAEAPALETAA